jgi:MFS transporter, FHS family, glucose/mannose:H+ symporter
MPQSASRFDIALVYLAGVAQGLALVSFPAASATFASPSGFALSNTQYGALFVPQVVLEILSSALAPRLARRMGLRGVLLVGLAADLLSMALLGASAALMRQPGALPVLCTATGALGLGFGATVMALNTVVEAFFPRSADTAVLALNALLRARDGARPGTGLGVHRARGLVGLASRGLRSAPFDPVRSVSQQAERVQRCRRYS